MTQYIVYQAPFDPGEGTEPIDPHPVQAHLTEANSAEEATHNVASTGRFHGESQLVALATTKATSFDVSTETSVMASKT